MANKEFELTFKDTSKQLDSVENKVKSLKMAINQLKNENDDSTLLSHFINMEIELDKLVKQSKILKVALDGIGSSGEEFNKITKEIDKLTDSLDKSIDFIRNMSNLIQDDMDEAIVTPTSFRSDRIQRSSELIVNSTREANREIRDAARTTGEIYRDIGFNMQSLGSSFQQITNIASEILHLRDAMNLLKKSIKDVYEYSKDIENTTVQFEIKLKNTKDTEKFVKDLREFANSTPLLMTDVSNAANILSNYGIAMDEVIDRVKQLGDLSKGQSDTLNRIALAVGQVASKGRLYAEETRQLTEAGVPLRRELMKTLNVTGVELDKMFKRGLVTIDMFWEAMNSLTREGGDFNGVLESLGNTTSGLSNILKDKLLNLGAELGAEGLEEYRSLLADIIDKVEGFKGTKEFRELKKEIGEIAEDLFNAVREILDITLKNTDSIINSIKVIQEIIEFIASHPMQAIAVVHLPKILSMLFEVVTVLYTIKSITSGFNMIAGTMAQNAGTIGTLTANTAGTLTSIGATLAKFGPIIAGITAAAGALYIAWNEHKAQIERIEAEYELLGDRIDATYKKMTTFNPRTGMSNVTNEIKIQVEKAIDDLVKADKDLRKYSDEFDKLKKEQNELTLKQLEGDGLSNIDKLRLDKVNEQLEYSKEQIDKSIAQKRSIIDALETTSEDNVRFIDYIHRIDPAAALAIASMAIDVSSEEEISSLFGEKVSEMVRAGKPADKIVEALNDEFSTKYSMYGSKLLNDSVYKYSESVIKNATNNAIRNKGVYRTEGQRLGAEASKEWLKGISETYTIGSKRNPVIKYGDIKDEFLNISESEKIIGNLKNITEAALNPSGSTSKIIGMYSEISDAASKYLDKQEEIKKQIQEQMSLLDPDIDTDAYNKLEKALASVEDSIDKVAKAQDKAMSQMKEYRDSVSSLTKSIKDANIALIDFSDDESGAKQLAILERLGIKPGQILKDSDKVRIAVESLMGEFVLSDSQADALSKKVSDAGNKIVNSGLSGIELESKAYESLNKVVKEFFVSSNSGYSSADIAEVTSRLYSSIFDNYIESAEDATEKVKESLNSALEEAKTLYDITKASRDTMNNYSQAWIDHNVYTKTLDEMEEIAAYQRVFNRKQSDIQDQILQKQKQIALVRKNSTLTELQKMQEISSINNDIREMNAEIMRNQDEIAKKREEIYKNTLYNEIQKLYDYEIQRIDEVVNARKESKEDKTFEERKRELEAEIELYSTSVSKEGQQKLNDLRKELKDLEDDYNDTLFNRQVDKEKNMLEERKKEEEKLADQAAFEFGQKYGEALNNEIEVGLERVRDSFGGGATLFTDSLSSYFRNEFVKELVDGINSAFRNVNELISGSSTNVNDNRSQTNNFYNTTYNENADSVNMFFKTPKSYGAK